jgi:hypothetical protein
MRKLILRTAIAAFAIASLGACVTIPERAWANGQGMSATQEYRMKMNTLGSLDFNRQRALYSRSNPLSVASPVRYTPDK